jgi:hypothetical protein
VRNEPTETPIGNKMHPSTRMPCSARTPFHLPCILMYRRANGKRNMGSLTIIVHGIQLDAAPREVIPLKGKGRAILLKVVNLKHLRVVRPAQESGHPKMFHGHRKRKPIRVA